MRGELVYKWKTYGCHFGYNETRKCPLPKPVYLNAVVSTVYIDPF